MKIKGIRNERPFYYFEEISKIPRGSGNEGEIASYIENFARERGLFCYRDEWNNVFIRKNASKGRENENAVMLQAHTDMVCEQNIGNNHNFLADEIELIQEGNILRANNTTLGADDGFGVAIMLAVLENDEISCPPLEFLFTSSEEIGLVGATKFDYSAVSAKEMINLDSAEENTVIIGCCGGVRTDMTLDCQVIPNELPAYKITIGGLCGGHSGEDIDRKRLNAHILMGQALSLINDETKFKISYISGGDKDNAIPRECECVIVPENCEAVENIKDEITSKILGKVVAREDEGLTFKIEKTDTPSTFSAVDTEKILAILSISNGVLEYRTTPPILPSISRNLARIRTEDDKVRVGFSSRAYSEDGLNFSKLQLEGLICTIGARYRHHEAYPSWQDEANSPLVLKYQSAYNEATGRKTEPTLIHAGLECGVITSRVSGLSAISVGANVHDLHTPKETMEIDSMDRIYDTVIKFLSK
jgi:dipeptidase D